jgi:ABC-type tungstate transport system substrate-binding protein
MTVTVAARHSQALVRRLPADVRVVQVGVTLAVSLLLVVLALHVPPFMAAGADLSDSAQRDYARNIWQETQTSLGLVAIVLPWMVYGLLWSGAPWGRRVLLGVATAGVVFTTWLALTSAQSYTALPRQVSGVVDRIEGRTISLHGGGSYYLVLSDHELQTAQGWLHPGTSVTLWVSPRGHAGAASPSGYGD